MSKDYSFAMMPSVSISRSRFERKSQHKTTFNLGDIIPIYIDETMPGDTFSLDMASLVRMSTPIAPIMDNIYLDVFAFFVPNRIVWDHWKEFEGENRTGAGIPLTTYNIPYLGKKGDIYTVFFYSGSYADYCGLPVGVDLTGQKISALPFRGLMEIYNRWFRNENLIAPLAVQHGDENEVLVGELDDYHICQSATKNTTILKASKLPDYFTKCLPYAQKGAAVTIPLGTTAPVFMNVNVGTWASTQQVNVTAQKPSGTGTSGIQKLDRFGIADGDTIIDPPVSGNMFADLSTATAASINQLRYAFQLQKLLEKDALYGTRYWEILAAHFGVKSDDSTIQDPEYLGGTRININIDQVLSTAGYAASSSQTVGSVGANSVSAHKGSLFTKSFTERGYVIVVAVARHDSTYGQGINRMWSRQGRFDFYWPVFANLGAQEVKKKEIYASGTLSNDDALFGYQEAWAEYRYKPSICTGLMRPGVSNNLGFWTLSENFTETPTLGQTFIEQGRSNLARALVTGASGPDFVADFYFRNIAVRPMPVYSIPGLIDHH